MSQPSPLEPTILGAVFRRWRLAAVFVMLAVALSLLYLALTPAKYQSTATVVLEDPRTDVISDGGFTGFDLAAYQAGQHDAANSRAAALQVRDALRSAHPDREFTLVDVEDSISVAAPVEGASVEMSFTDTDAEVAQDGAQALLEAYLDLRPRAGVESLEASIDLYRTLIGDVDEELLEINTDLAELNALEVDERLERAGQLTQLQAAQSDRIELKAALQAELVELDVQKQGTREDNGIALKVDATSFPAERVGSGAATILTLAIVLGGLLGTAVAYLLSVRRREFADKAQPEVVLGAPLIAEIANPAHERLRRLQFPVVDAAGSAVAEGFRFVSSAIATELTRPDTDRKSVGIAAPTTTPTTNLAVANIGLALASQGLEVLLVDADIRRGELTDLLCAEKASEVQGLSDVLVGSLTADRALRSVVLDSGDRLELLSAGTLAGPTAPACRPDTLRSMLTQLEDRFDVVLINVPALLHSADSSSVLGAVGNVVLLVDHGSSVDTLLDSAERIDVAGVDLFGYVYTNAPLSRDLQNYVKSSRFGGGGGSAGNGRIPGFGGRGRRDAADGDVTYTPAAAEDVSVS
jgi:Mrp family chromosome partitioning ATPase